jgi:hypothetical protein
MIIEGKVLVAQFLYIRYLAVPSTAEEEGNKLIRNVGINQSTWRNIPEGFDLQHSFGNAEYDYKWGGGGCGSR